MFIDYSIRCRKKSQDVGYEVLLCWRESVPVCGISREVNLLGSLKGRFRFFVHPPDDVVLDGEEDNTIGVCLEERFGGKMAIFLGGLVL